MPPSCLRRPRDVEPDGRDGFVSGRSGKSVSMSEQNMTPNQKTTFPRNTAVEDQNGQGRTLAPAERASDGSDLGASDTTSALKSGAGRAASAANDAVQSVAEAGRRVVVATSGKVAASRASSWTAPSNRKLAAVAAGVGLSAVSYAVGRRSGRHTHGPLTRMTGGRI